MLFLLMEKLIIYEAKEALLKVFIMELMIMANFLV
jgi:hypothetical protein